MAEAERRLAAIMMADVVGYSRMINQHERGAHNAVQATFREVVEPAITGHRGRKVKQRGDGFLATFDSTVEAVRCAIVIQQSMVGRNLETRSNEAIRFRIGINLGEVIVEPDDVYGDGVNVAARLEQLAEPGGIYISGSVYEQIRYKLVCGYQSLGDRKVKNILDPIPIYRVLPDPASVARVKRNRQLRYAGMAALVAIVVGVAGWFTWPQHKPNEPQHEASAAPAPQPITPAVDVVPTPAPSIAPKPQPQQQAATTLPPLPPSLPIQQTPPPQQQTSPPQPVATPAPKPDPKPEVKPAEQQQALMTPPKVPEPTRTEPRVLEPETVAINGGVFLMGSTEDASEQPPHKVVVKSFQIGKYPVTVGQFKECTRAQACAFSPAGDDLAPVNNVSWMDAVQYVTWLARVTGKPYRLPTEAEWEYAARGGTDTRFWWGNAIKPGLADCKGCGQASTKPDRIGNLPPNPYGVFDVNGGLSEWVQDCWVRDYRGAPDDGSAKMIPQCQDHVLRGSAWTNDVSYARASSRDFYAGHVRYPTHGFRVARSE